MKCFSSSGPKFRRILGRSNISLTLTLLLLTIVLSEPAGAQLSADTIRLNCLSFTKSGVPAPTPQTDPHAIERFQFINKAIKSYPDGVLFVGDSLTEDWDAAIWQQHFARRRALNAGIRGDRTEHLLWRLQHGNLDGPSPTAVVLLIGTNDVGRNRTPGMTAEGIRDILLVLRSRFPEAKILLLGLLPRSESPASERRWQVNQVNRLIRRCEDRQHIFYAAVGGALLDSGGQLPREISPDGVHLSPRGYAILATRLDAELDRVLPNDHH
jgi:lysophospholipase L1-like esterase